MVKLPEFFRLYFYYFLPVIGAIPKFTIYAFYNYPKIQFAISYFHFIFVVFGLIIWVLFDKKKEKLLYYFVLSIFSETILFFLLLSASQISRIIVR